MKYQNKSFSEFYGSKEYRDNWESIFGKKTIYKMNKNCQRCGVELREDKWGLCEVCNKWLEEQRIKDEKEK
jgi:lipopolysaccharide biosynthesis regulator YciM